MMNERRRGSGLAAVVVVALTLANASCGSTTSERADDDPPIASSRSLGTTRGPNGEQATPTSALQLTSGEVATVRAGRYTAALVWHQDSDFVTAVTAGARGVRAT